MTVDHGAVVRFGMLFFSTRALRFIIEFWTYCVDCISENNSKSASKLTFSLGTIGEPSYIMTSETAMVVVGRVVK